MKENIFSFLVLFSVFFFETCSPKSDHTISSPDGQLSVQLKFNRELGELNYLIESRGLIIVTESKVGISTSLEDFRSGLALNYYAFKTIDEVYTLPQGKVSSYRNNANEMTMSFSKNGRELNIVFRVYDDGIAFRFEIPGTSNIEIYEESTTIALAGNDFKYWGQNHPNRYGYEGALGPINGNLMSCPVLAYLKGLNQFVLMGQAATYGHYIQPHFERTGSTFNYMFPLDQEKLGLVRTTLPFLSPWRMIIISPDNPGKIIESYLMENLNPPTKSEFINDDGSMKNWIQPGNVMWDYIAKDGDKPRMWIDVTAEMGWNFYMADAGFANRWGGIDSIPHIIEYAEKKNVNVIGWAHTREFDTPQKAAETMSRFARWGLKGAKIDFFDHNTLSENPREWRDYEDTQQSLQMRDWIFELGMENNFLLELHGNTMPTGERRQYPNLMTLEGVDGLERRTKPAANDLTIPFVRNVMGPVSYTVIHFERSPGTHAYQLAMPIIYEAGLKIFAEHGKKLLEWSGQEMITDMPTAWDETRYIDGFPASHIVIARRKGQHWYVGAMTDEARNLIISFNFLDENTNYNALIFKDENRDLMKRENVVISYDSTVSVDLLERGGFAILLVPSVL